MKKINRTITINDEKGQKCVNFYIQNEKEQKEDIKKIYFCNEVVYKHNDNLKFDQVSEIIGQNLQKDILNLYKLYFIHDEPLDNYFQLNDGNQIPIEVKRNLKKDRIIVEILYDRLIVKTTNRTYNSQINKKISSNKEDIKNKVEILNKLKNRQEQNN